MKKYARCVITLVIPLLFIKTTLIGQPVTPADSLLYYLQKVKSPTDSITIRHAFENLYKSSEATLLNGNVMAGINKLKTKLSEVDCFEMMNNYTQRLFSFNTPAANLGSVSIAQEWISQNENTKSRYGHYIFLNIFR